jgi:glycosyltransferase EpsE
MGIYNCADTLGEAIDSIVNQTFTEWELIMCDDGSKDNTLEVALEYQGKYPDKIVVLQNEKNMGLNATLNKCLQVARVNYIARMDGDDICSPDRFQKEIDVLEHEPNIAIVSTDMNFFDETGMWGRISHPEYPEKNDLLAGSPFCHAPCMVRREAYDAVGGYSVATKLMRVEDYHLWFKMYKAGYRGKNIQEALYSMRDDQNAYQRRKFKYRINEAYVKYLVVKELKLPIWGYVAVLRPIIVGLLPNAIYDKLHKRNLRGRDE